MAEKQRRRIHIVYRTTNLVNGKFYIGVHTAWSVDDEYLGSGDRLKRAVFKHGRENFQRVVLWIFDAREDACNMEKEEIGKYLGNVLCMNIKPGGEGGGWTSAQQSENGKRGNARMKVLRLTDPVWRDAFARKSSASGLKRDKSTFRPFDWTGRNHREETKKKIGDKNSVTQSGDRNSQFGTCWINSGGQSKRVRRTEFQDWERQGWQLGMGEDVRSKLREKYREKK